MQARLEVAKKCVCVRSRFYGQATKGVCVDALAQVGDEGRGLAAISFGKPLTGCDPEISEWGNPTGATTRYRYLNL